MSHETKKSALVHSTNVKWSDIDKVKFYGIGTGLYTAITITLHPINVIKTRQQVLTNNSFQNISNVNLSSSLASIGRNIFKLYRGIGIILVLAIPTRGVYIGTLENSRDFIRNFLSDMSHFQLNRSSTNGHDTKSINAPLLVSISGGIAGGVASMAAQTLAVPMDIISQKQMVMNEKVYAESGSAVNVISNIIKNDGWRGFYRGLGLGLFTSLPVGSLWWGTYSGAQHVMNDVVIQGMSLNDRNISHSSEHRFRSIALQGTVQIISGLSAAIVAATLTQPLDVIKTRLQVGGGAQTATAHSQIMTFQNVAQVHTPQHTYSSVVMDVYTSFGIQGFYRGLGPRVVSMGLWGTALSSAYEYLRHVSRMD
jgi:Mitochondrial carrier protein.